MDTQTDFKPKTYIVDIDGTICTIFTNHKEYHKAEPYYDRIKKINDLYDEGHNIIYWTARGSRSGVDCKPLTQKQLSDWGCKYTELKVEVKPFYDVWIDDKAINASDFF